MQRTQRLLIALTVPFIGIGGMLPLPVTPAFGQDAGTEVARTVPTEYVELAEDYARQRVETAALESRRHRKQQIKRWTQMLRSGSETLESAERRSNTMNNLMLLVEQKDPEITRIQGEIGSRVERAYDQAKAWADVEEVATGLPEGFANMLTGQLGIKLDFGGDGPAVSLAPNPTTPTAELIPPQTAQQTGWLNAVANSDEMKGAGGLGILVMMLLGVKRMRDKDQKEGDKRNEKVTSTAMERYLKLIQAEQAATAKAAAQQTSPGGAGTAGART